MRYYYFLNLVIVLFLASCSNKNEIKPIKEDIQELVFATGQLEWDDLYNVTSQTDGILETVNFDIGKRIEKGVLLAKITNENNNINLKIAQEQLQIANSNVSEYAPALTQVKQNIEFAKTKYEHDKLQLERFEELYKLKSCSKVELETAELNAKNSRTSITIYEKQYENLYLQAKQQQIFNKGQELNSKVTNDYNFLKALHAGTVIKKYKSSGDYIKKGEVLATIANDEKVEVILNVDENNIEKVRLGQTVFIQLNTNKNKKYLGKISEILSAFDTQNQSFNCKVVLSEKVSTNLFGTQVEANILVNKKEKVLLIPRDYLGFGNKVNLKGKGEIIVKTGIVSTEFVEILEGITINDVILPLKLK